MAKSEQINPRTGASSGPRRRSSGLKFFASSAIPKLETVQESHKTWEAAYLKTLRANKLARPGGSRPLPPRVANSDPEPDARASSAVSFRTQLSAREFERTNSRATDRCASAVSHRRAQSVIPTVDSNVGGSGRGIAQEPTTSVISREFSGSTKASQAPSAAPDIAYRESGMRWVEKQEAKSLREALEDMDLREEAKLYAAAQDEATELVVRHRNPGRPFRYPGKSYRYKSHLEKGAHARSQSLGWYAGPAAGANGCMPGQRSDSNGSNTSRGDSDTSAEGKSTDISTSAPTISSEETRAHREQGHPLQGSPQKDTYMGLGFAESPTRRPNCRSIAPRARDVSGGLFRNPDDKIYEEPDVVKNGSTVIKTDASRVSAPLATKTRNTISTTNHSSVRSRVTFTDEKQGTYISGIHRNPPSQSPNLSYKIEPPRKPPEPAIERQVLSERPATRDGKEIRSDEIRAATSMRMKDRSPKLPSPTVVSDRPGRPIVSFDQNWVPKDIENEDDRFSGRPFGVGPGLRFKPHIPQSTTSATVVPTINSPDAPCIQINDNPERDSSPIPAISISEVAVPSISLPDDPPAGRPRATASTRFRPAPANPPLPHHSSTTPVHSSKFYWSPSSRRATAQCAACALPIEGRIVSASSQRFHPHCFTCHHCAEALECVAFYPEPDTARNPRLARIVARANGDQLEEKPGKSAADDGDASLRFYCHLDYHELFSPRCRSCKTPIETEVVLACGGSWHVGHFFCAECGDPFDAKTPFVERNGYAWCLGCHAGKFSGKCKGCKKPVVDGGVCALGSEWHVGCFCCVKCGCQFEDGRFYTRGNEEPVCVGCEERRLKA